MHALPIAAGFLEPGDMPVTVALVSLIYLASVAVPVLIRFRFRRSKSEYPRAVALGVAIALLGPLAVRTIAIRVQGRYWADWHFLWLYLLASSAFTAAYFTAIAIWRFVRRVQTA